MQSYQIFHPGRINYIIRPKTCKSSERSESMEKYPVAKEKDMRILNIILPKKAK